MVQSKVLSYIGLAQKSRNVVSGEFLTEEAVKDGSACVVIVAGDASDNTKKKFTNMCAFYEVPIYIFSDKDALGHSMGKEIRASLAVTDNGLANAIIKNMNQEEYDIWQK